MIMKFLKLKGWVIERMSEIKLSKAMEKKFFCWFAKEKGYVMHQYYVEFLEELEKQEAKSK